MTANASALAAIDAAFEEPVYYAGGGLPVATQIPVIWIEQTGPSFQGGGATTRQVSCEVRYALLSERPRKADRIERDNKIYQPIDVTDLDAMSRWLVTLEEAAE